MGGCADETSAVLSRRPNVTVIDFETEDLATESASQPLTLVNRNLNMPRGPRTKDRGPTEHCRPHVERCRAPAIGRERALSQVPGPDQNEISRQAAKNYLR